MRRRWQIILPVMGLLLFAWQSVIAIEQNVRYRKMPFNDFWWGSIQLQPEPCLLHENGWGNRWVEMGAVEKILALTGLPAFVLLSPTIHSLDAFCVNEIHSFFICAPVLLVGWYWFIGGLIDRRRWRKKLELE